MKIQKYQVPAGSIPAGTVPDINFAEILELQKQGQQELAQQKLDEIARYNWNTIYNTANPDHPLPVNVAPSHGGEIRQGPDKLYKNAYDRWTDNTAYGQEFKRFVNGPTKFFGETVLGSFAGQELLNGTKIPGTLMTEIKSTPLISQLLGTAGTSYYGAEALKSLFKDFTGKQKVNPISTGFNMLMTAPIFGAVNPVLRQAGYAIEHLPGYQLRSLMRGNPLEKQLSKTGSISVNSIQALTNKASNIEREVINKVLAEKFAGQKNIDYNQFRRAIQEELVAYERTPDIRWDAFGMNNLGYNVEEDPITGGMYAAVLDEGVTPETYLFHTKRIPLGSDRHYDPSTLGHIRTYTDEAVPERRFILENQSDWGQRPISAYNREIWWYGKYMPVKDFKKFIANTKEALKSTNNPIRRKRLESDLVEATKRLANYKHKYGISSQQEYLHDNYLQRQIQEALQLSAQRGEKYQLYPTPETAAKIEGYIKDRRVPDELRADFNEMQAILEEEVQKTVSKHLPKEYLWPGTRIYDWSDARLRNLSESDLLELQEKSRISDAFDISELANELNTEVRNIIHKFENSWFGQHGIVEDYTKEQKSILKKYADFPRIFKKLYGQEPRLYTDPRGNTWYEITVPENYLDMEWRFKTGGKLKRRK